MTRKLLTALIASAMTLALLPQAAIAEERGLQGHHRCTHPR